MYQYAKDEKSLKIMRATCADAGKLAMQRKALNGTVVPLKLCYKPSIKGVYGVLRLVPQDEQMPVDFVDSGSSIGTDVPYENYFSWVANHSRALPVLAF